MQAIGGNWTDHIPDARNAGHDLRSGNASKRVGSCFCHSRLRTGLPSQIDDVASRGTIAPTAVLLLT